MFIQIPKRATMVASAFVIGCVTASFTVPHMASGQGFERVASEAAYRKLFVGKKSYVGEDWYLVKGNGRIVGMRGGKKYRANWAWRDGFVCRTELTHRKDTDCQLFEVSDTAVRITRKRGRGESFVLPR